jgi:hypothetical protein
MDYDRLHRALGDPTARHDMSRWASDVLSEIAQGRTRIAAVRHPLGFVCIPVERIGGQGICVHVWSDHLTCATSTTSAVHAHSWDLISYVLYGSLRNEVYEVTDVGPAGSAGKTTYRVFEIHSGGDSDEVLQTPRLVHCEMTSAEVNHEGDAYALPAGIFHATVVQGEAATMALGSGRPQGMDLSLGGIDTTTHRVRRQRCDRDDTARVAQMVVKRLARIRAAGQEVR